MTSHREQRCENCRHWEAQAGQLASAARNPAATHDEGTCNIGPPTILLVNGWAEGVWPRTHRTRFCGEWDLRDGGDGPDGGEELTLGNEVVVPIGAQPRPRPIHHLQTAAVRR